MFPDPNFALFVYLSTKDKNKHTDFYNKLLHWCKLFFINPYIKVTHVCSICLYVMKDFANHWTNMVLLYNVS